MDEKNLVDFVNQHRLQLQLMGIPDALHNVVARKVLNNIYDIGEHVTFAVRHDNEDNDEVSEEADNEGSCDEDDCWEEEDEGINSSNRTMLYNLHSTHDMTAFSDVYLLDHMWTTTFPQSREQLKESSALQTRLSEFFCISSEDEECVDKIWNKLWGFMQCYLLPSDISYTATDDYTQWYLLDEVGLAINHSKLPNTKQSPLLVSWHGQKFTVSLLWPVANIEEGELLTRDYLPGVPYSDGNTTQNNVRKLRLISFIDCEKQVNYAQKVLKSVSSAVVVTPRTIPAQSIPKVDEVWTNRVYRYQRSQGNTSVKVFCDRPVHLNDSFITNSVSSSNTITVTNDSKEVSSCDVLFLIGHTIDEDEAEYSKEGKVTNQFWWDGMIVSKEHLLCTVRRAHSPIQHENDANIQFPTWFPPSYDLSLLPQLVQFIGDYYCRASKNEDNIWILKRYRGRQSIDYPVTTNISCALRHQDASPRIACKYISQPLLLQGRKFDLRFYVLIESLNPLRIKRYNMFVVRQANLAYDTNSDDLEMYQKHFTLMSLLDDEGLVNIRGSGTRSDPIYTEFIELINKQFSESNSDCRWETHLQPAIDKVIVELFQSVERTVHIEQHQHPSGVELHPNSCWSLKQPNMCPSRAMYGIDVIISEEVGYDGHQRYKPNVLEVQFGPDCAKAIEYQPSFWYNILSDLYLDSTLYSTSLI